MLFLGAFLKILDMCKKNNASQNKIVTACMRIIDTDFKDSERGDVCSKLAGGQRSLSGYAKEGVNEILENGDYECVIDKFEKTVIPLIKENERQTVLKALILTIKEDSKIAQDTVVDLVSGVSKKDLDYNSCDYSKTLVGIFFYVLSNTSNIQEKGYAKQIAEKYIDNARKNLDDQTGYSVSKRNESLEAENIRLFEGEFFSPEGLALILGKWDETNNRDIKNIEKLTGNTYTDFRERIRIDNHLDFESQDGIISINNLTVLRIQLIEEIDELHFKSILESVKKDLFSVHVFSGLSNECMEGIADFIAILSVNSKKRKRLSNREFRNDIYDFEKNIICGNSEDAICSFLRIADVWLETDIETLLCVLNKQIQVQDSKLIEMIKNNNGEVVYPIADVLRKAAMSDKYFPDAMMLFHKLSEINSLFEKYMKIIMAPAYIQTTAGIDVQMGVIKKLYRMNAGWTWDFVADLIPGNFMYSYKRLEYRYLPIHVDELSKDEYEDSVKTFISFLCDNTNRSTGHFIKLISVIPYVDNDSVADIEANFFKNSDYENADILWGTLQRVYDSLDENDEEKKKMLDRLMIRCYSGKKQYLEKSLFSYQNSLENRLEIIPEAKKYVNDLYQKEGIEGLETLAGSVEDISLLTDITVEILSVDQLLELITLLDNKEYSRYKTLLVEKLSSEELIKFIEHDSLSRMHLLAEHSIDNKILIYENRLNVTEKNLFWKCVSVYGCYCLKQRNYVKFINQLSINDRCDDAIHALAISLEKNEIDVDLIIQTLNAYDIPGNLVTERKIAYDINKLIGYLQNNDSERMDEIVEIEQKYFWLLLHGGKNSPKYIFYKIAGDPKYVNEMLKTELEHSKNGQFSLGVDRILHLCNIAPGILPNGTFDFKIFTKWKNYLERLRDSKIKDKMLMLFAKMIINTPVDSDGFIMNRKVADYIETCSNDKLLNNIKIALLNSIGPIRVTNGAEMRKSVVKRFRESSDAFMLEGYIEIGRIYRNVADIVEAPITSD